MFFISFCLQSPIKAISVRSTVCASALTGSCTPAAQRTGRYACGRRRWGRLTACGSASFLVGPFLTGSPAASIPGSFIHLREPSLVFLGTVVSDVLPVRRAGSGLKVCVRSAGQLQTAANELDGEQRRRSGINGADNPTPY